MKRWRLLEKIRNSNKGIKPAIDILCNELRKDEQYYYGWQSNIAMAFVDNHKECNNYEEVHELANKAAKQFLDLLIKR